MPVSNREAMSADRSVRLGVMLLDSMTPVWEVVGASCMGKIARSARISRRRIRVRKLRL